MSSIIDSMLAPVTNLMANTAELVSPKQKAMVGHLADPMKAGDTTQDNIILKRFLAQFENIKLDYNEAYGDLSHPEKPLTTHPHIQFIMCSDDRKTMQPEQLIAYLAREADRGNYILQRLGIETEDFYVNADDGLLRFDAKVSNPPQGMTEKDVLKTVVEGLQQACKQARDERKQAIAK